MNDIKIGDKIILHTGKIVGITEYPELGLKYYIVKVFEPYMNKYDTIYIEQEQIHSLLNYKNDEKISLNHINRY